jgi:hypothetical protein
MLSVDQCKKLLGAGAPQDEAAILQLRDSMYALAGVIVEARPKRLNSKDATAVSASNGDGKTSEPTAR